MTACDQMRAVYLLWRLTVLVTQVCGEFRVIYMLLHYTEVLCFNCGLSVAKYWYQLSAMKNENIDIGSKRPYRSSST